MVYLAFVALIPYASAIWISLAATGGAISLHAFATKRRSGERADDPRICSICRITHTLMLLAILGLGSTAFYSVLFQGHLAHWLLLAHVLIGGGFVALLAVVAVMFAPACRPQDRRLSPAAKLTFWLLLVLGTLSGSSMLLSMLPVFGTEGLEQLLDLHRWAGLCLVIIAMTHAYSVVHGRRTAAKREF